MIIDIFKIPIIGTFVEKILFSVVRLINKFTMALKVNNKNRNPINKLLFGFKYYFFILLSRFTRDNVYRNQILPYILKKDSNCIDIGAHVGRFLNMIIKLSPHGRHYAFEPISYKARWLRWKYPKTQIFNIALSNKKGNANFSCYKGTYSGYSGFKKMIPFKCKTIKVRTGRLDDIIKKTTKIDFIKIDVEGSEFDVLKGSQKILRKSKPVIFFECTALDSIVYHRSPDTIYNFLTKRYKYKIYTPLSYMRKEKHLSAKQFREMIETRKETPNFIACA